MLENLDALVALARFGTVSEAAVRLRVTQSAVSKRLQALTDEVGVQLVEPEGRRLRLTPAGADLVERARPLLADLRGLLRPTGGGPRAVAFRLALADSIASSWGPAAVQEALAKLPWTKVELHAHRSVLVLESVRLGRYDVGLCTEIATPRDLIADPIAEEPMVVIHARLARRPTVDAPLVTIEPDSATWRAIEPALVAREPRWAQVSRTGVESFAAVAQMARAGFGNGLVPRGLAQELGLPASSYSILSITRRLALYTRKTIHNHAAYASFRDELARAAARWARRSSVRSRR
jgi:DNA-binding transcriptional LysR family regulator